METIIRHYQPNDRLAVFELSADTAYFGEPVEAFLEDRQLYSDAFTRYYIEHEAAQIWIAESHQEVTGYLLGCLDTRQQSRRWRRYIVTLVLVKALRGGYKLGRKTAFFASSMLAGLMRGEALSVDLAEFPAHLHINVKEGYRGMGAGQRLMSAYLEQLRQLNCRGVHLETTDHNDAACHLYEKVGFRLLDHQPNRYWTRKFGFDVNNLCYGLKLI